MLRSKSSNGKGAKLHTVAESYNRGHQTRSLYYYLFVPHIFMCCFSRTSHLWWITISIQLIGCNNISSFMQWTAPTARFFVKVAPGATLKHILFLVNRTFNTTLTETLQHLQQVWATLVEMTECEGDKQNANWKKLDIGCHFLTCGVPFHSMLGAIS